MTAGATAFTAMPRVATSLARAFVRPMTPALAVEYGHEGRIALLARNGRDINDASAPGGEHHADGGPADQEHAGEVAGDHLVPVLVSQLPDRVRATRDPGVVDHDVETAPRGDHALHRALHVLGACHVGDEGEGAGAEALGHGLDLGVAVE